MPIHMIDSQIYGGAWSSDEMRGIFDDIPRTQGWLNVIATLAEAQAEVGLIPAEFVPEIRRVCQVELLSMDALRQGYQAKARQPVASALRRSIHFLKCSWQKVLSVVVHSLADAILAMK